MGLGGYNDPGGFDDPGGYDGQGLDGGGSDESKGFFDNAITSIGKFLGKAAMGLLDAHSFGLASALKDAANGNKSAKDSMVSQVADSLKDMGLSKGDVSSLSQAYVDNVVSEAQNAGKDMTAEEILNRATTATMKSFSTEDSTAADSGGAMGDLDSIWNDMVDRFYIGQTANEDLGFDELGEAWSRYSDKDWDFTTPQGKKNWKEWAEKNEPGSDEFEEWAKSIGLSPEQAKSKLDNALNAKSVEDYFDEYAKFNQDEGNLYNETVNNALSENKAFQGDILSNLSGAKDKYQGDLSDLTQRLDAGQAEHNSLLDALLEGVQSEKGGFAPMRFSLNGQPVNFGLNRGKRNTINMIADLSKDRYNTLENFVQRSSDMGGNAYATESDYSTKASGIGNDLYDDTVTAANNRLENTGMRNPAAGKLAYLEALNTLLKGSQDNRKIDLEAERIAKGDENAKAQLDQNEPGFLDELMGGVTLLGGVKSLFG